MHVSCHDWIGSVHILIVSASACVDVVKILTGCVRSIGELKVATISRSPFRTLMARDRNIMYVRNPCLKYRISLNKRACLNKRAPDF